MNQPVFQSLLFTFIILMLCFTFESNAQLDNEYTHLDYSIEFREFLGHRLSQQDWAAEVGTDALLAAGANLKHKKLVGFIVENNETHWTLSYLGKRNFSQGIYYQIEVTTQGPVKQTFKDYSDKPVKLTDWQKSIFRASKTAMKTDLLLCSNNYNSVVLTLTLGETKYLYTYFLAASNKPNISIMGGHHRFILNADGKKILQHKAHTKSCLTSEIIGNSSALGVTHFNDTIPNELHIYMSYLYEMPVFVIIAEDESKWLVQEGKITAVDSEIDGSDQQSPNN